MGDGEVGLVIFETGEFLCVGIEPNTAVGAVGFYQLAEGALFFSLAAATW
jgi:hypothetical protein